ncbi:MAG: aquaporin, partial [Geminicoccaceae bacterium]
MKRYLAEAVGTFILVLFGCGAAVLAGAEVGFLGIAFAFGLALI